MAELYAQCSTPDCLRGVGLDGGQCKPCSMGMPPMKNPKSPHAWKKTGTPSSSTTTSPTTGTGTTGSDKPKVSVKTPEKSKNVPTIRVKALSSAQEKSAVELIFKSFWYGWKNGVPDIFNEIFAKYGSFLSGRVQPSQMVGTPQKHYSSINSKGKKAFVLLQEVILPMEGESKAFKMIKTSPNILDQLGDVSPTDAIEFVKNHGKAYEFTKKNEETYTYEDDRGVKREIPTWAIA